MLWKNTAERSTRRSRLGRLLRTRRLATFDVLVLVQSDVQNDVIMVLVVLVDAGTVNLSRTFLIQSLFFSGRRGHNLYSSVQLRVLRFHNHVKVRDIANCCKTVEYY